MPSAAKDARARNLARRQQVLQLTMAGSSLRAIAAQLEISHETARLDLNKILQDTAKEQVQGLAEYRTLMNERYNRQLAVWWPRSLGVPTREGEQPGDPDSGAFDRVMKIMDAQRRLNGLDEIT